MRLKAAINRHTVREYRGYIVADRGRADSGRGIDRMRYMHLQKHRPVLCRRRLDVRI